MQGIGMDLVETERIARSLRRPRFFMRVFSPREQALLAQKRAGMVESAAANFAAKEAFAKAVGTGVRGFALCEVEVLRDALGRPCLMLSERLQQRFAGHVYVTLTHTRRYAAATVVWEKEE